MKNKLKEIIIIFAILFPIEMIAQTEIDTQKVINYALKSEYIFEGEVIEKCSYIGTDHVYYTNNIVEIYKIGKGNLNCGTVSIITKGGRIGDRNVTVSHSTEFTVGFTGVFFCNTNVEFANPNGSCITTTTNTNNLIMHSPELSFIGYYTDYVNSVAEGLNSDFATLQDLYDFVQNNSPFGFINCQGNFKTIEKLKNFESSKISIQKILTNIKKPIKKTRSNDLNYSFTNESITGNTTKYFEFDVNIFAPNNNLYLDGNAFRINFDTLAFDTSIVNTMSVSLIPPYLGTTYNNITLIKKAYNVVSIWNHHSVSGQPRTLITTTPTPFLHVKIPFKNCGYYPNIYLDTFSSILSYSFYANSATTTTYNPFSSVILDDTLIGLNCRPYINSITSDITGTNESVAGVNEIITIKGKHFCQQNKSATVFLTSADDGGLSQFPIQAYDIIPNGWTDTMIQFNLASTYDSTDFPNSYNVVRPGSGYVLVFNEYFKGSDQTDINKNYLKIDYSIFNRSFTDGTPNFYYKNNAFLFGFQPNGKYKFQCNNNITKDSMKWCISSAINRWRCLTGVNFEFDFNPTSQKVKNFDSINIIMLSDTINNLAQTLVSAKINQSSPNDMPVGGVLDIDMQIDQYHKYYYDTTGNATIPAGYTDFFKTILHEFGHAILLQHVNDSLDLMYYAENPNTFNNPPATRFLNFTSYNNIAGDLVVNRSVNEALENIGDLQLLPMIPVDTCFVKPLEINNKQLFSYLDIKIYPNPNYGIFNLEIPTEFKKKVLIYDVTGRQIKSIETTNNKIQFDLSSYTKGIYIAEIIINDSKKTIKILCE